MSAASPCCLECRWCSFQVGLFGSAAYHCSRKKKYLHSDTVHKRSCDRFERSSR